jgi:tRNA 2-thiouridine synthesizing protein A
VSTPGRVVDARGMLCPWPVLRLSRAARELGPGAAIRILADDPVAPAELAKLCAERGWDIAPAPAEPGGWDVLTS